MAAFLALGCASLLNSACTYASDTDYDGPVLEQVDVAPGDKHACCAACNGLAGCTVSVLLGAACYLKNSSSPLSGRAGRTACKLGGPPSPSPSPPAPSTPGHQHPQISFPDGCSLNRTLSCSPTYDVLQQAGQLWPCPDGERSSVSTWPPCLPATVKGSNPLCPGALNNSCPCASQ